MNYKLLVVDVDGTVTNSAKAVTKKTREAILHLQERGVRVVIASGRAPNGVFPVAQALGLPRFHSYILAFNGAKVISLQTRACVYEEFLPTHVPQGLLQDSRKYGLGFLTYSDAVLTAGTRPDRYMALESQISNMPIEYHRNFKIDAGHPVNGCLLTGEPNLIARLEPLFAAKYGEEAEIFRSEPYFLEVVPKGVDKGHSLKRLIKLLHIRREETVCCGDSFNDITMVQFAGVGVAMANAQDAVKEAADYVTRNDNDHDGVAEVIEKFFREPDRQGLSGIAVSRRTV